jgi:hypothetical protein
MQLERSSSATTLPTTGIETTKKSYQQHLILLALYDPGQ